MRHLLEDVQKLPESQRTALLLREIDALSYDQISEAMETTIPSVKSLLVRARMSLAEAAEARQLTCDDVRRELAEVAEGLKKGTPALRRHMRDCDECREYRTQLRKTNAAMALAFPVGAAADPQEARARQARRRCACRWRRRYGRGWRGRRFRCGRGDGCRDRGHRSCGRRRGRRRGGRRDRRRGRPGERRRPGLGAVATKAVAGVAVTAIIAGGAVEAKRVAAPEPVKPAVSAPAPAPAPAVNPSGGASLHGAPAALVEPAQQAADEAKGSAEASATDQAAEPAGTTGATGAVPGDAAKDRPPRPRRATRRR